ncbi:MAG: head GIN domain-containing protein, partial [Bacteroidales bacterium]|nr:head GIN domain-containing protein [Bacteroidales bacterium]
MKKIFSIVVIMTFMVSIGMSQSKITIDADDFTGISFGVAGRLTLEQGNSFKVVLEGDEDLLDAIDVKVRDGRLIIRKPNWRQARNEKLSVYVIMPEIKSLSVSGSGTLMNKGLLKCNKLNIGLSGSGDVELDGLTANSLDIGISGSGGVMLEGNGAEDASISISGSGGVTAEDFKLEKMEVSISGSG